LQVRLELGFDPVHRLRRNELVDDDVPVFVDARGCLVDAGGARQMVNVHPGPPGLSWED
jgi:hypothetical protein